MAPSWPSVWPRFGRHLTSVLSHGARHACSRVWQRFRWQAIQCGVTGQGHRAVARSHWTTCLSSLCGPWKYSHLDLLPIFRVKPLPSLSSWGIIWYHCVIRGSVVYLVMQEATRKPAEKEIQLTVLVGSQARIWEPVQSVASVIRVLCLLRQKSLSKHRP